MNQPNLNTLWAKLIVEELTRLGVTYFCICPGSRSTPLTVAVARNPNAKTIICIDERSAAFHALGYAKITNIPAAVITTSGTALANLYPAVIEASASNTPMILLTADRPAELIDTGANQTIDQQKFFGQNVRYNFDLPCPDQKIKPEFTLTTIDQAACCATQGKPGPTHINCRFRTPLEPTETAPPAQYTKNIEYWLSSAKPFTTYDKPQLSPSKDALKSIASNIIAAKKGLLVIGELATAAQRKSVLKLSEKLNWPIVADITSSLRLTNCPTNIIRYFDQQLLSDQFNAEAKPQTVLHIGDRTTSKRIGEFLDANRPENYIVIKETPDRLDPIHAVTNHLQADIAATCDKLSELLPQQPANEYANFFADKAALADNTIAKNIDNHSSLTEPYIARTLANIIPDNSSLFISNSMPIRDVDIYAPTGHKNITIAANRGTSGIDGITSTASGFATGRQTQTTLLIGDLAFIHDINALSLLNTIDVPLITIVINNNGGGIFHFLPISQTPDVFEKYFATPHNFNFKGACETFKINYLKANTKTDFIEAYNNAVKSNKPAVIEVTTNREENLKLRRNIKKQIINILHSEPKA